MPATLSVRENRSSRSRSPGGREPSRSRNDDRDENKRPERSKRSSKRYSETESEEDSHDEDARRYSSSRSGKKHYDSPSEDEKPIPRLSRHSENDERDDDRYRSSRPRREETRPKYREASVSDDDRRKPIRRSLRKASESESEDDRYSSRKRDDKVISPRSSAIVSPRASGGDVIGPIPPPNAPHYAQPHQHAYNKQPIRTQPPPGAFPADAQTRHTSFVGHDPRYAPPAVSQYQVPGDVPHRPRAVSGAGAQYASTGQFQYATVDPHIKYKYDNKPSRRSDPDVITADDIDARRRERAYSEDKYKPRDTAQGGREEREAVKDAVRRGSRGAAAGASLGSLAVIGHPAPHSGGKPPASPLLEAYKGTYQSISPMPNALVLANHKDDSDLSDLALEEDSDSGISDHDANADLKRKIRALEKEKRQHERAEEHARKKKEKEIAREREAQRPRPIQTDGRQSPDSDLSSTVLSLGSMKSPRGSRKSVSFYDAEDDAKELAAALKGTSKPPNVKPLIKILPALSIDDLDALKAEYKKVAKIDGQGINLSKHIKTRVPKYLGKAAYACSLGQWESEGFWANCFYQAGASRRELLIESLMGRTNQQIREIKNFFKDRKYDDDLEKCMKTELKADKFRAAILLALEERRMPESATTNLKLAREDARDLYETLHSPGGESAMIQIIVLRSDSHLRQVLRTYEQMFNQNFAREMINKSRNLVGETLAHILNGALNKGMRDALLLHQAISETEPGKDRAELLISRLIRLHWEPKHLERTKQQYEAKYRRTVESAIRNEIQSKMKTEEGHNWTNFCINLLRSSEPYR